MIILVYKVEDYINEAVGSALKQDEKDFEVVLVDDGSPVACPKICGDLVLKYARVKVIHKQNDGVLGKVLQEIKLVNFLDLLICNFVHWYNNEENIAANIFLIISNY